MLQSIELNRHKYSIFLIGESARDEIARPVVHAGRTAWRTLRKTELRAQLGGGGLPAGTMDDKLQAILAEMPRLRRYARALLRDADTADDLVQDCLERALNRLDNWQRGENPRRWLFTIMHNLFIDQMRRAKAPHDSLHRPDGSVVEIAEPPAQMDSLNSRDVLEALQGIHPDRRAALVLVAVEGMSYAEAATVLDIPSGTLMSRIARARGELKRVLDDTSRRRRLRVVE